MQLKELCQPFSEPPTPISDDSQSDWITVYWTFCMSAWDQCGFRAKGTGDCLCSTFFLAPPSAHWFIVFIFSDDDLGKSDSSSGSMDSIQVGPAFSAGSSRRFHLHVSLSQQVIPKLTETFRRGASLRQGFILGDLILCLSDAKLQIDLIPVT